MIKGNHIKIVKGVENADLTPEEKGNPFFIIRDFIDKLIIL